MRLLTIPKQSSVAKAWTEFGDTGRMKPSPNSDRIVDVMEELMKFTLLTRDIRGHMVDRQRDNRSRRHDFQHRVGAQHVDHPCTDGWGRYGRDQHRRRKTSHGPVISFESEHRQRQRAPSDGPEPVACPIYDHGDRRRRTEEETEEPPNTAAAAASIVQTGWCLPRPIISRTRAPTCAGPMRVPIPIAGRYEADEPQVGHGNRFRERPLLRRFAGQGPDCSR